MDLNELALTRCDELVDLAIELRVVVTRSADNTRIIDCGVHTEGGLEAGRVLAEVCLASLGRVHFAPPRSEVGPWPTVVVSTDQPVAACMASQYAGWQITGEKFFAMGSGPMRAAAGNEELFNAIGYRESPVSAVGVLETAKLPPDEVCRKIAADVGVEPHDLTLLAARTASLAGSVQVVARSVETALHKMHEIGFDLARVVSGFGLAPLPPVAVDDLTGIGRTNDAVLYGGEVTLWVRYEEEIVERLGPNIPSSASSDHGRPFGEIFESAGRDFYQIDPLLFSPAVVTLVNLETGRSRRFGELRPDVLQRSFDT
ncbi:MAG: methenyltetrahydromethanopterin cyclohydrolase [Pirellulaceae bacterium]